MRIIVPSPTEWEATCPYCAAVIGYVKTDVQRPQLQCEGPSIVCCSCRCRMEVPEDVSQRKTARAAPSIPRSLQ